MVRRIPSISLVGFVHDGLEAIAYVRGIDKFQDREMFPYPDLLLLDYQMPRCNGIEVLENLRHFLHWPRIVLWSVAPEEINTSQALRLGADLVCKKPFNRGELNEIIERLETRLYHRGPGLQVDAPAPARACA